MRVWRKLRYWFLWVSGVFLAIALALQVLAPRIIDLAAVRNRIEAALSRELGGEVTVQRLDLSILPRPCVNARSLRISVPGMVEGTVDSLSIYPRILPLLRGKLRVAQITAETPDLTIRISGERPAQKKGKRPATLEAVKEAVTAAGARLASLQPSLTVVIHRGRVALSQGRTPPIVAEHIDAKVVFPPAGFIVNLDCHTPFWENLTLKARLDPATFAGDGSIEVEALKPHLLGPYLFPDRPPPVGESLVDLDLSFKTDGVRSLQVNAAGSAPHLRLLRGRKPLLIEDAHFRGSVELDEQRTIVTLDELEAASPRLALKGKMHSDEATRRVGLTITGSDIDIQAFREAACSPPLRSRRQERRRPIWAT